MKLKKAINDTQARGRGVRATKGMLVALLSTPLPPRYRYTVPVPVYTVLTFMDMSIDVILGLDSPLYRR